jgi:hypothetical protein
MSWSVGAFGRAEKVRVSIADQFSKSSACVDPEEGVRQAAAKLIDTALAAQDPQFAIEVSASGSQSFKDWQAKTGVSNTLSISIVPKYNFVE